MKVGFVLSQPFGQSIGTDVRIKGLMEGLGKIGVEIHFFTPFSEDIEIDSGNLSVHKISSVSTLLKMPDFGYKLFRNLMASPFWFRNVVCRKSMLTNSARSLGEGVYKAANKLDLDVLQGEQQIASIACAGIGKRLGVPVVADFHNIWSEEVVASNLTDYGDECYNTILWLEKEIIRAADAVTVVSEEARDYVRNSLGAPDGKAFLIPNATFLRVEEPSVNENSCNVMHAGTLHIWENVELYVEAMPFVLEHCPNAKFFVTRKGEKLAKMMKLAHDKHVSPEFVWFESEGQFFDFLKTCDVGVISPTTHLSRKMAYPAKLYDYLSVGLPIVSCDIGAWTNIIKDNKVGLVTENNPESFAEGISTLLQDPELRYQCAQRAIALVKNGMNYYNTAKMLFELYEKLVMKNT
jgi:glycosyltransferase involved in cell wall biosynthesis